MWWVLSSICATFLSTSAELQISHLQLSPSFPENIIDKLIDNLMISKYFDFDVVGGRFEELWYSRRRWR